MSCKPCLVYAMHYGWGLNGPGTLSSTIIMSGWLGKRKKF
uniref:Uncharacterized protein n=1 Tax=Setaria italica TaxID=4555 RepID=K4A4J0_SETIT